MTIFTFLCLLIFQFIIWRKVDENQQKYDRSFCFVVSFIERKRQKLIIPKGHLIQYKWVQSPESISNPTRSLSKSIESRSHVPMTFWSVPAKCIRKLWRNHWKAVKARWVHDSLNPKPDGLYRKVIEKNAS